MPVTLIPMLMGMHMSVRVPEASFQLPLQHLSQHLAHRTYHEDEPQQPQQLQQSRMRWNRQGSIRSSPQGQQTSWSSPQEGLRNYQTQRWNCCTLPSPKRSTWCPNAHVSASR